MGHMSISSTRVTLIPTLPTAPNTITTSISMYYNPKFLLSFWYVNNIPEGCPHAGYIGAVLLLKEVSYPITT